MYHGEVNVAQDDLNTFLAVAEDLKIKGLTQNEDEGDPETGATKAGRTPVKQPRPSTSAAGAGVTPMGGTTPLGGKRGNQNNDHHSPAVKKRQSNPNQQHAQVHTRLHLNYSGFRFIQPRLIQ